MKLDEQKPYEVPNTQGQTESSVWFNSRNCRITASMAQEVSCVKSARAKYKLLEKILWGKKLPELKSLMHGRENEHLAFQEYVNANDIITCNEKITKSGFWIDPAYPELGCSPDGLIFDEDNQLKGVLEIKCPIVLKDKDPLCLEKLKKTQINHLCYKIMNNSIVLKESHKYYAQVQMQMGILGVNFCDFVIWSSVKTVSQRITFDLDYWEKLRDKLLSFHHCCLMPEYLEMRVPRKLLPIEIQF